jgi:hypothetical protein
MELTQAEIERYAPYHTFPEFEIGYLHYLGGAPEPEDEGFRNSVAGQAYDRGAECAMRRRQYTEGSHSLARQPR